ncbi:MAG: hypothetical protein HFE62_00855 [Firmicutes bacterium]|nr:hypothetical protein [Bacillota bacterium]
MAVNIKALAVVALTITSGMLGCGAGYIYTVNKFKTDPDINERSVGDNAEITEQQEALTVGQQEEKITPSTKMVYRYNFADDRVTEEVEEEPSYYLIDLTLSDLLKYYSTWDIVSFSSKEVVMEKTVYGPSMQRYVVGEKDGYIAVYFEKEQNGVNLKEVTSIPVDGLNEEERMRLMQGVKVIGKEALARTLEDYGS